MPRTPNDPTIQVGMRLFDGTTFDTIVERVEYGGFGVIAFGPNRLREGQMVAYKTLRRELLDDPLTRSTFVRECLLWIGLWGHPNVAVAYAALKMGDAINQRPFLALAYAEDGSLRTLLRAAAQHSPGGRLPLDAALYLAQQIAAGLAYLHQPDPTYLRPEPTIHRDLKPENVLLMGDGRAAITDFGLAKALEDSPTALAMLLSESALGISGHAGQFSRQAEEAILVGGEEATRTTGMHTAAGVAMGTLAYMPPEQWEDARYVRTSADVYALGIMLSEMLAGRHALLDLNQPQTQANWRAAHRNPQPRSLREVVPDAPAAVETIYRRCLAQDPDDRPSASDVLSALQEGARSAGLEVYAPFELVKHTPYNEFAHWHVWSIAYDNFELYPEALARSDRALTLARQLHAEQPELLPAALMERGDVLKGLGGQALEAGDYTAAAEYDRQVEACYQESLATRPPATTQEGRTGRAYVWHQIGVFNSARGRYAHAENAYDRALNLEHDMADTFFARGNNLRKWGLAEERAGHRAAALEHLHQARIHAVTSLGMNYPPARRLFDAIEGDILRLEAAGR